MPRLNVKRDLHLDDAPKGTPLTAGAVYLKGSPIDVTDAEADALLEHYPEHFGRTRGTEDNDDRE